MASRGNRKSKFENRNSKFENGNSKFETPYLWHAAPRVIPAKAGIHRPMDPRLRGGDVIMDESLSFHFRVSTAEFRISSFDFPFSSFQFPFSSFQFRFSYFPPYCACAILWSHFWKSSG